MKVKTKYSTSHFKLWKEKVLAKMKEKITDNKQKIKLKQVKPVLSDPDVKKHQKELHRKIVIVTINKASNNFAEGSPNKTKYSTSTYLEIQKNK